MLGVLFRKDVDNWSVGKAKHGTNVYEEEKQILCICFLDKRGKIKLKKNSALYYAKVKKKKKVFVVSSRRNNSCSGLFNKLVFKIRKSLLYWLL